MLFILWISLLPLIVFKGYYEGPKVFWLITGGVVLLTYWILKLTKSPPIALKISKSDKYYLIWLFIALISGLIGIHPQESILGGSYRHQGLIFFLVLWLVSKTVQILKEKQKLFLYKCVAMSVLVESILVLWGVKIGTIGEINAVAGFLVMGVYFVHLTLPKWLLIFPLMGILLEFSRASILSTIGYLNLRSKKHKLAFVIIGFLFLAIFASKYNFQKSTVEDRFVIWKFALEEISKKFFLGYGLESGEVVFDNAYKKARIPLEELIIDRSHNLFLDMLMWSGIIGFIPFLLFLKNVKKTKLFWVFLIYSMFQPLSVVHWTLFFLVI